MTKLEEVARTLQRKSLARGYIDAAKIDEIIETDWRLNGEIFMDDARAAIEAHETWLKENGLVIVPREPTQEMQAIGNRVIQHKADDLEIYPSPGYEAVYAWRAMVSTALDEKASK